MAVLETYEDAETYVSNSGVIDWEFGGGASLEGLTEWLFHNYEVFLEEHFDEIIAEYLIYVGEDPSEYGLQFPD